jgi:hypothetical protein
MTRFGVQRQLTGDWVAAVADCILAACLWQRQQWMSTRCEQQQQQGDEEVWCAVAALWGLGCCRIGCSWLHSCSWFVAATAVDVKSP